MGDYVEFKIGDLVTRKSYNNDLLFRINEIKDKIIYLTGVNIRLCADSEIDDLEKCEDEIDSDEEFLKNVKSSVLERDDYFYLPGKILHIDADSEYLERCLKYYENENIWAAGILEKEANVCLKIRKYLDDYKPDIVVITGHDAYYKKLSRDDINSYKNSSYYVNAIKEARNYEKSHQKLVIVAGGCQSDYEELIKAGANFASSPKRINIHALDPAIVAAKLSLSDITADIDLKGILDTTKYGKDGMGGVKTKGTMYIGYPR